MDTTGNTWKQHLLAVGFRLVCMVAISVAGLVTAGGAERPDGSEQAAGVGGLVFVVGVVAALVFAFVAWVIHFCFRHRQLKTILIPDAVLAAAFLAFMAYTGAKAKSQPSPGGKTTAASRSARVFCTQKPPAPWRKFGSVLCKMRVVETARCVSLPPVGQLGPDLE